ncbi:MAG: hypothetical protein ACREQ5_09455 [Candidatus Dormibacteria bacterium]
MLAKLLNGIGIPLKCDVRFAFDVPASASPIAAEGEYKLLSLGAVLDFPAFRSCFLGGILSGFHVISSLRMVTF